MTQLLMFLTKDPRSFGERASEAGIVSLQGMLTIFAVLALLWGAVELFRVALSEANRNKTKKAQSNVPAVEPDSK